MLSNEKCSYIVNWQVDVIVLAVYNSILIIKAIKYHLPHVDKHLYSPSTQRTHIFFACKTCFSHMFLRCLMKFYGFGDTLWFSMAAGWEGCQRISL